MEEVWSDIPNYEGFYQINEKSQIKSIAKKELILKQFINSTGYLNVTLYKNKLRKQFNVHRLMALSFLKPQLGNDEIIDHIDNNPLNNRLCNIQITTKRINSSKDRNNKSSSYTGVSWYKNLNKWRASIYINDRVKHLGYFENEIEASERYVKELSTLE